MAVGSARRRGALNLDRRAAAPPLGWVAVCECVGVVLGQVWTLLNLVRF